MNGPLRWTLASMLAVAAATSYTACVVPHCTAPDYADAECRVIAENERARLRHGDGAELRFQDPSAQNDDWWEARGLLRPLEDGTIIARVAGAGAFALSLRSAPDAAADTTITLRLLNVDPAASILAGPADTPVQVPSSTATQRQVDVVLAPDEVQWIRGERPCPSRYRLAFVGDVQTNPDQFQRIIDRISRDAEDNDEAPLVGLVLVGDLTESSRDDEFDTMREILAQAPIPVAVTPGNHDIYRPARPHFNRAFGPGNHAFDVCGVRVALFDSGSGTVASSVLARAAELLDRGDATFLVAGMHHPPYAGLTGSGWSREDEAAALLVELALAGTDLLVAGHNHALRTFDVDVGGVEIPEVIVGTGGASQGMGIPRFGYLAVTFDDETAQLSRCFVEVPPPGYSEPPNEPTASIPYCVEP